MKELGYRVFVKRDVVFALHAWKRTHPEGPTGVAGAVEAASPRHDPFAGVLGAMQALLGSSDSLAAHLTSDMLAA